MWRPIILAGLAAATLASAIARGDPPTSNPTTVPTESNYITREEYNKLKSQLDAVTQQMADQQKQAAKSQDEVDQSAEEVSKRLKAAEGDIGYLRLGTSKLLITGYTFAGYSDIRHGPSTFSAGISPIVIWSLSDRMFVEAELELGVGSDGTTDVNLEYADINYIVNKYVTLRAGKFLTPFGQFPERLHPAWINKLPDFPLVYNEDQGLVPFSSLGVEASGAAAIGSAKIDYALYAANGPQLITNDSGNAGSLDFHNNLDINHNKAVGGRFGFLPLPELELGYSFQFGQVSPDGSNNVDAFLEGVDMSYIHQYPSLGGTIDARAEWVWSSVGTTTFDSTGSAGFGPLRYHNYRDGGYFQLAYRPSLAKREFCRNLEFVARYDILHVPDRAPGVISDRRTTLGIDYWLGPSAVVKIAYEFDDPDKGLHHNGLFIQAAVGF